MFGVGGNAGWPNGSRGSEGTTGYVGTSTAGYAGLSGDPCDTGEPAEDTHHDGSDEDTVTSEGEQVAVPQRGAFAERFESALPIASVALHGVPLDLSVDATLQVHVWDDQGGQPGAVLATAWVSVVQPCPPVARFVVPLGLRDHPPVFWVGVWGDWPGQAARFVLGADLDGPGGGTPMTFRLMDDGTESWVPAVAANGPVRALALGVNYDHRGACCVGTGCCRLETEGDCAAAGGLLLGVGATCDASPCAAELPHHRAHDIGRLDLTVTDQGSLGYLSEAHTEGQGLRFEGSEEDHLRIGSLWVGLGPDYVANRDYDLDPAREWTVAFCPAGQVKDDPNGEADQSFLARFTDAGADAPRGLLLQQRTAACSAPANGFVIYEATLLQTVPGGEAFLGLFLEVDVNGDGTDDVGGTIPDEKFAHIASPGGPVIGIKLLGASIGSDEPANVTLVPNETFIQPQGYAGDLDKWLFLTAGDADHVFLEGAIAADYSMLVSARRTVVEGEATPPVAFAVAAGWTVAEALEQANLARERYLQWAAGAEFPPAPSGAAPAGLALVCSPNPASDRLTIRFDAPAAARTRLAIHDARGRLVRRLEDAFLIAGTHHLSWDGRDARGRRTFRANGTGATEDSLKLDRVFSVGELEAIASAAREAERRTSAEIVPYIVAQSDAYESPPWMGAVAGAILASLAAAAWHAGGASWGGRFLPWIAFPSFFGAVFGFLIARLSPAVRRGLIHPHTLEERVQRRAQVAFLEEQVFLTRERTGILLFVSLFERRVVVLGDAGINAKVPPQAWDAIADGLVRGMRRREAAAMCRALESCARLLEEHGLARPRDDRSELSDDVRLRDR